MTTRNVRKSKTRGKAKIAMVWDAKFNPNLWTFGYEPLANFKFFDL